MARRPEERTRTWNLPYVQELIQVFQDAQISLGNEITRRRRIGNLSRYQEALLRDVNNELDKLNRFTDEFARRHGPENYANGAEFIKAWLQARRQRVSDYDPSSNLHINAINAIVENISGTFRNSTGFMGRRIEGAIRQAGLRASALQLSAGQTVSRTREFLVNELASQGFQGITDRSGRVWQLNTYAQMVARTTSIEAINTGRFNALREDNYDLVKMTSHFGACPICGPLQGRVYSISGNDRRYPSLYDTALSNGFDIVHPNCAHTFTPYIEDLDQNFEKTMAFSNRPINEDSRSESSREAFQRSQVRRRQLTSDRKQYTQYRAVLGSEAPKSFAGFRRMKQSNSDRWKETRREFLRRKREGELN